MRAWRVRHLCLAVMAAITAGAAAVAAPLKSGPQPGARPLPFTSNMVTGSHRGQQHCYVCEITDEPAVLVFARATDEPTARLMRGLRDAVRKHEKLKLFGWMVFLAADPSSESAVERQAYEFARANGATNLPVSVLGDPQGPPGYLIAPEAHVTVIVFQGGKVLHNRAYSKKEWSNRSAGTALNELPKLLKSLPGSATESGTAK